jgi:hypothetical protein
MVAGQLAITPKPGRTRPGFFVKEADASARHTPTFGLTHFHSRTFGFRQPIPTDRDPVDLLLRRTSAVVGGGILLAAPLATGTYTNFPDATTPWPPLLRLVCKQVASATVLVAVHLLATGTNAVRIGSTHAARAMS